MFNLFNTKKESKTGKKKNPIKLVSIIIVSVFGILIMLKLGLSLLGNINVNSNDSPIVKISGTCDKEYLVSETVDINTFNMRAIHEDGKESNLPVENVTLLSDTLPKTGGKALIPVALTENNNIGCYVEVKIQREPYVSFTCGYPTIDDVKAVLYTNGELRFEGKGDFLVFDTGNQPWLNYDGIDEHPIKAVSFDDTVAPVSLNYLFRGLDSLEYVDKIPNSVVTMVETFSGCQSLSATADWSECTNLINADYCYYGDSNLVYIHPLPSSLRTARSIFNSCESLAYVPDVNNAINLTNTVEMFANCKKMTNSVIPPNAVYIDGIFANCINLRVMPDIPVSVESMSSAFSNNISMTACSTIPKGVLNIENCFNGCELLEGEITINCNADSYSGLFSGACLATKLTAKGESFLLSEYVETCDTGNINADISGIIGQESQ